MGEASMDFQEFLMPFPNKARLEFLVSVVDYFLLFEIANRLFGKWTTASNYNEGYDNTILVPYCFQFCGVLLHFQQYLSKILVCFAPSYLQFPLVLHSQPLSPMF